MSEDISITNEEYKQLINFHNKKIDHVYILPFNESNPNDLSMLKRIECKI